MEWSNINMLFSGIVGGLIASIIGFIGQQMIASKNLKDSLDSKSGWRKEVFKTASKYKINLDDVCKIRATLRYKAKDENINLLTENNNKEKNFPNMTSTIIIFCEKMIKKYENKQSNPTNEILLEKNEAEQIRIISRYLLKHHWEDLNIRWYNFIKRSKKDENEAVFIADTLELIRKENKN